jgi:phosphoserine phosphatase RsbX
METALRAIRATWGVATATAPGESESGDRYVVAGMGSSTLVAVIDALGHGHQAAVAAGVAAEALAWDGRPEGIERLAQTCHDRMRVTRGATLGLAVLDWARARMHWIGVGNITGLLQRRGQTPMRPLPLLAKAGVIGDRIPRLRPSEFDIGIGDQLVIATDGVHEDFGRLLSSTMAPQALADVILKRYAKGVDDALVLVVRCDGTET